MNAESQQTTEIARLGDRTRWFMAQAWDAAIEHVWELSDPINTVEHDDLTPVNTAADMRQAKRENPYRVPVTRPAPSTGREADDA